MRQLVAGKFRGILPNLDDLVAILSFPGGRSVEFVGSPPDCRCDIEQRETTTATVKQYQQSSYYIHDGYVVY